MIDATEADIGRRVVYDPRPIIPHTSAGRITAVEGRNVWVKFDFAEAPLCVISNLKWGKLPLRR